MSAITETSIVFPWYLNAVYILVGGILVVLAIIIIVYKFKKVFNGWFGIFAILVPFYTLYLILKIYLGIINTEPRAIGSIWAYIIMIVPDMLIIFYSLSTLMGSQAELLSKRIKRFGLDTVIIWLILSKVTYEFIHYFPYDILDVVPIPWIQWFTTLDNDLINLIKNIAVLIFFIVLLIVIGMYEIRKYSEAQLMPKEKMEEEPEAMFSSEPTIEKHESIFEPTKTIEEIDTIISREEDVSDKNSNEAEEDVDF
ncbi:MAG: hypothetical protein ACFFDH_26005 [Promethearchaeota archaeon]